MTIGDIIIGGACTNPDIVQTLHYMLGWALVLMVNCVCWGLQCGPNGRMMGGVEA
jgi:hypothetical protein